MSLISPSLPSFNLVKPEQTWGHARLLVFCAGVCAALLLQHTAPVQLLGIVALAAIAVAIWHGAFDTVLGEQLFAPLWGPRWRLRFLSSYVLLALAAAALWWCAPALALVAFLLYSAWHFGTESLEHLRTARLLPACCAGAIPIAAACHWQAPLVTPIFAAMLHAQPSPLLASHVTAAAGALLWPLVTGFVVGGLVRPGVSRAWWVALPAILLLFRFCSPVFAFAVYFCLWHTPEHLITSSLDEQGTPSSRLLRNHLLRGLLPWLVTLLAFGALCLTERRVLVTNEATMFILLSALTIPHMLLNEAQRFYPPRAIARASSGVER